jgi:hypothetical protein
MGLQRGGEVSLANHMDFFLCFALYLLRFNPLSCYGGQIYGYFLAVSYILVLGVLLQYHCILSPVQPKSTWR